MPPLRLVLRLEIPLFPAPACAASVSSAYPRVPLPHQQSFSDRDPLYGDDPCRTHIRSQPVALPPSPLRRPCVQRHA
ncbi:hypothetical protein HYPSUDRAFT_201778 [Hypholoma sublateritium FD-334 SS-4]|uniref:Secreted protein n=1 Tax=Hypholoma sublateritium (strain FD-334 SS-4) TaxID=945553 RepID=A0A0D2L788_HYPSF|nr:hypothetical protein HYPSUDRAFT_201778 [Hypholoma sublateritium FD-334 SS-4]